MRTTSRIVLSIIIMFFISSNIQSQNWLWAHDATQAAGNSSEGISVATDASGNVFDLGVFYGSSKSIQFGSKTVTDPGHRDVYLVKYDAAGNVIWATCGGGDTALSALAGGVSLDALGNIYIAGQFTSPTMKFGSTVLSCVPNKTQIFLVKYDPNGNVLWARSCGDAKYLAVNAISSDPKGNVFLTGSFKDSTLQIGSTTLTNAGGIDIFIAKYDTNGNLSWAKSEGGLFNDYGTEVCTDPSGNVYFSGNFQSPSLTFGSSTVYQSGTFSVLTIYLTKFDSSGNAIWAKSGFCIGNANPSGLGTDASGNIYLSGIFDATPTIAFGSVTITNPSASNGFDPILVKFDPTGKALWGQGAGGSLPNANPGGSSTDKFGNTIVSGHFSGTLQLGSTVLNAKGTNDIYIAEYDAGGNIFWAQRAGGAGSCLPNGVSISPSGSGYLTGYFTDSYMEGFGTDSLYSANLTGAMNFLAKISGVAAGITEEGGSLNTVLVYPNPGTGLFNVEFDSRSNELIPVEVFDLTGRMVFSALFRGYGDKTLITLDLSNLDNGIYLLKVKSNEGFMTKRLVKEY